MTVTGNRDALTLEHLLWPCPTGPSWPTPATSTWRSTWPGCARAATAVTQSARAVAYHRPSGGRVVVLAEGRLVGQACAEAPPGRGHGPDLRHPGPGRGAAGHRARAPAGGRAPGPGGGLRAGRPAQAGRHRGPPATTSSAPPSRATCRAGASAPDQPAVQAARPASDLTKGQSSQPSAQERCMQTEGLVGGPNPTGMGLREGRAPEPGQGRRAAGAGADPGASDLHLTAGQSRPCGSTAALASWRTTRCSSRPRPRR